MECDRIECYLLFFVYFTYFACLLAFTCRKKVCYSYPKYGICATACHTLHSRSFAGCCASGKRIYFSFVCCIPHGVVHKLHIECCSIWLHLFKCAPYPRKYIYRNDEKQLTQTHTHTLFACV